MILKMFCIFDNKADCYLTPFFFPHTGQAVRAFKDLVADKNSTVGRHPDDYKLVHVGNWDDSVAEFEPTGVVSLGFGSDYVEKSEVIAMRGIS